MSQDLRLSTVALPLAGQTERGLDARQNVQSTGALAGGGSIVDDIAALPGEQTLRGIYRGVHASEMATELDELGTSPDISAIPLFDPAAPPESSLAGYYVVESVNTRPETPQSDRIQRYRVGLTRKGTRKSHWRQLSVNVTQPNNDFGNTVECRVGVPAAARTVRWLDGESGDRQPAGSPASTVSGEWADVDLYDPEDAPISSDALALIYDVPYSVEESVDVRVWDTRGNASKTDTDGDVQWQKVFHRDHEYSGRAVLDTGRIRVFVDEGGSPTLEAERWNDTSSAWESVSLGTSGWELLDLDISRLGLERVTAYCLFEDTSNGDLYPLNGAWKRGLDEVQWTIPANTSGPVPTDLVTLLDPIASERVKDANATKGLHARRQTRD